MSWRRYKRHAFPSVSLVFRNAPTRPELSFRLRYRHSSVPWCTPSLGTPLSSCSAATLTPCVIVSIRPSTVTVALYIAGSFSQSIKYRHIPLSYNETSSQLAPRRKSRLRREKPLLSHAATVLRSRFHYTHSKRTLAAVKGARSGRGQAITGQTRRGTEVAAGTKSTPPRSATVVKNFSEKLATFFFARRTEIFGKSLPMRIANPPPPHRKKCAHIWFIDTDY